jgi:choline dehydrogenase-like flavoprotein
MGSDPSNSIVDGDCRAHEVKGLVVVDASVIPSAGAVNSTLTIVALALKAGKAALESHA